MTLMLRPPVDEAALFASMQDFRCLSGPDLIARTQPFLDWQDGQRKALLWPYGKCAEGGPLPECRARHDNGMRLRGINFASQDCLNLSTHPAILDAAGNAIARHGVHGGGSPALMGSNTYTAILEKKLAHFLRMGHAVIFPTGWSAGYSVAKGLLGGDDHVVIDARAQACLQEGAFAATRNVHVVDHGDNAAFGHALSTIRAGDREHAILVLTESLFHADADTPDLATLQSLCSRYKATLAVDVSHDLGAIGYDGTGHLGRQDMLGKVDLVTGSFAKTFAANGGFILTHSRAVREYLRCHAAAYAHSNALSPVDTAVIVASLGIVRSRQGSRRRKQLMDRVERLRAGLTRRGFTCLGDPSPVVPVRIGNELLARMMIRALAERHVIANMAEYPDVMRGGARLCLHVMADHTSAQIDLAVNRIDRAMTDAHRQLGGLAAGDDR